MQGFSIQDIANLSGIKAHTLRIWEQRYSFIKPKRSKTNIRFYTNEEVKIILQVSLLNRFGLKVSHINHISLEEMQKAVNDLTHPDAQKQITINNLILTMLELDLKSFTGVLNRFIVACGINELITDIIYPFLIKIELLQEENHFSKDYEHVIANIIRQKIITGIEITEKCFKAGKTILTFLPEGEFYELELLYLQYILLQHSCNVIYLGANVPVKDIKNIAQYKKPDYIHCHLNCTNHHFNTEKFLRNLGELVNDFKVIITGCFLPSYKKNIPAGIFLKTMVQDAVDYIAVN